MAPATASKWIRVNKHNPCLVCGKPDWCLMLRDQEAVICARVRSDQQVGSAGWLHKITVGLPPSVFPPEQSFPVKQLAIASITARNITYKALLNELTLSGNHHANLRARGLDPEQIRELDYKTLPFEGRWDIVRRLRAKGLTFAGIPGFGHVDGKVRLFGSPGLVIPVRDKLGYIQALQIRLDGNQEAKYRWLSSARKPYGCGPGVPIHIALPQFIADNAAELWITEGPLKADIISLKLKRTVLAVAGVGNWRGAIRNVLELKPRRVIVAFDMDKVLNPAVQFHRDALIGDLIRRGVQTFEADWDSQYKGLDDFLTAEANNG